MRTRKPDKTRLWWVGTSGGQVIYVSKTQKQIDGKYIFWRMRIRTISPRAAGRKYLRDNLSFNIASACDETDNIMSPDYMDLDPERVKFWKGVYHPSKFSIEVLK